MNNSDPTGVDHDDHPREECGGVAATQRLRPIAVGRGKVAYSR